jgi:hypothetical protein
VGLGVDDPGSLLAQLGVRLADAKHRLQQPVCQPGHSMPVVRDAPGRGRLLLIGADEPPEEAVPQGVNAGQLRVAVAGGRAAPLVRFVVSRAALRARGRERARRGVGRGGVGLAALAAAARCCRALRLIDAMGESLLHGGQLRAELGADECGRKPSFQGGGKLLELGAHEGQLLLLPVKSRAHGEEEASGGDVRTVPRVCVDLQMSGILSPFASLPGATFRFFEFALVIYLKSDCCATDHGAGIVPV